MRIVLALLLYCLILPTSARSQQCPSTWPPEIHGVQLGMTVQRVKSRLPFLKIPPSDKYRVRETFAYITADTEQRKRLPRVFKVEMWFWENRLVRFVVQYYGSDQREAVDRFVTMVVKGLNLSEGMQVARCKYECGYIRVSVGAENRRTVMVEDLQAEPILVRRVEESYGLGKPDEKPPN